LLTLERLPKLHLLPRQADFIHSPVKYTAYVAGLGSGKTFAGCVKALKKCAPGQDGMIVAPTFPMLRDVTQKTFFELLEKGNYPYTFNKAENSANVFGAQVLFRSADEPDRLRGVNLNWAYVDEAATIHTEDVWRIILGRLREGTQPQAWITTTPAGFNWVYKYWVERGNSNYALFHSSTRDNKYLPAEYLADLEANYAGEFAKQEIEGEFVAFEGLVYLEFSRNQHIYQDRPLPESWPRVRGIDFGYTNPFVCLWGAIDEDNRLFIYKEHYRPRMLVKEHAAIINAENHHYLWTVSDHDAQDQAELKACGIYTRNAQKDVILGIQRTKARLKVQADNWPRLLINERCINTIKEFSSYRWQESKEGRNDKEEPVKENDHCFVGNTGILTYNGYRQIKDIRAGDYVFTSNGFHEVLRWHDNGEKEVKEYQVNGNRLECTPNHKIITGQGDIKIDLLTQYDTPCILDYKEYLRCKLKELFIAVSSFGVIRKAPEEKIESISFQADSILRKAFSVYIDTNTNAKWGRFRKVLLFTIRMTIHLIMRLEILSLWLNLNMRRCIPRNTIETIKKKLRNTWKKSDLWQVNGTVVKSDEHGIVNMLWHLRCLVNASKNIVLLAVRNIRDKSGTCKSFAVTTARQFGDERAEKIISKRLVRPAGKSLRLTNIQERNAVAANVRHVYDLTVNKQHEYYANNILVHNCMDTIRYMVMEMDNVRGRVTEHASVLGL